MKSAIPEKWALSAAVGKTHVTRTQFIVTVGPAAASLEARETFFHVLQHLADKALYQTKKGGRNRVCALKVAA